MAQLKIFVSHSHQDDAFCRKLVTALRDAGADVWYDESNLGLGHISATIMEELSERAVFVVVLSKAAFKSDWVYNECFWTWRLSTDEPQRVMVPVTAQPIDRDDFKGRWLFLEPYKRIEAAGYQPYPQQEAIARTVRELIPIEGECIPPLGATAEELTAQSKVFTLQEKYDCAARFCQRATELRPDYFSAWFNLAWTLNLNKRYVEATAACERALALSPNNSFAWNAYACVLNNVSKYPDALNAAERALASNPNFGRAWTNKGWALLHMKRSSQALEAFEKAIAVKSKNPTGEAESGQGMALAKLGRFPEALAVLDNLLTRTPFSALAWRAKGEVLMEAGRYDEALAAYNQALLLDGTRALTWERKAEALRALGRDGEARHALKQARERQGVS